MKVYSIVDNVDTRTGLRLVGIDGAVVHTLPELRAELEKATASDEIGILLITELLSRQFPDIVNDIKLNRRLPLVVEIPDRHGSGRRSDFITAYIREAIGVKMH